MTAIMNGPNGFDLVGQPSVTVREKSNKHVARPAVKIELKVGPEMALICSAPVAVALTALVGWVLLTSLGMPLYGREMTGAAIINAVGGILAILPLLAMMKKGTAAIARGAILAIGLRTGFVLLGILLALGPGWHLELFPLAFWVLGCYFPMLIAETAMIVWLCQKNPN